MRRQVTVVFVVAMMAAAMAAPGAAAPNGSREVPVKEKPVVDGRLNPPSTPNPFTAFLAEGQRPDYLNWSNYLNAAGKLRASQEAPGAPRRGLRVAESEPPGETTNDTLADAEPIGRFGTARGSNPVATITGTAPEQAGDVSEFEFGEPDGSLGLATKVPLEIGDTAIGSGEIGDEESPPDFDFFALPNLTAGETIIVDIDTPEPFGDLDPFVAIWNPDLDPFEIAVNDDGSADSFDSYLVFTVPQDGTYYVSVGGWGAFVPEDPTDPESPSVTGDLGSEGVYDIRLSLVVLDTDFYSFDARPGDIVGATADLGAVRVELYDGSGHMLIGSSQNVTFIHPWVSPLLGFGNAAASYVIEEAGTYAVAIKAHAPYELTLRAFRPAKELTGRATQTLFVDFDGADLDPAVFGGPPGSVGISPLASFLEDWALEPGDEDAVIDAILAATEENLSSDLRESGNNGDRDAGDGPGSFDIEILNSRDHPDPWGDRYVSRVIVGGTADELGILTIGIAQSIDVGDFESEETAIVLLDILSSGPESPFFAGNSLNWVPLDPGASMIDLIGQAVGNIVAHEAGHFFANWHTDQFNPSANIMDQGGNLLGTIGVGPDGVFGTGDDVDVDFGKDHFVPNEGFWGIEDTLQSIAFGLSTGRSR